MSLRRELKDKHWAIFYPNRAFGCRVSSANQTKADDWLKESSTGYTLRALEDLGLLDLKYNLPSCPNGCNLSHRNAASASWFSLTTSLLEGRANVLMIDGYIDMYIYLPAKMPTIEEGDMDVNQGFMENVVLKSIEQYHLAWPDVHVLPVCISMTSMYMPDDAPAQDRHALGIILHIDFLNQKVGVDYYDPWGSKGHGTAFNAGINATRFVADKVGAFLSERFFSQRKAALGKLLILTKEEEMHEGLQRYETKLIGKRKAYRTAVKAINEGSSSPALGDCTVFVCMMFTLSGLFPTTTPYILESDVLMLFMNSVLKKDDEPYSQEGYFRILARGTGNLTRVFSSTLAKHAMQDKKRWAGLYCCFSKQADSSIRIVDV